MEYKHAALKKFIVLDGKNWKLIVLMQGMPGQCSFSQTLLVLYSVQASANPE